MHSVAPTRSPISQLFPLIILCSLNLGHADTSETAKLPTIEFTGKHGGHLQGIATDGNAIFWSHSVQLVRTTKDGKETHRVDVKSHHGDLTHHNGRVYVAVEFGQFNQPAGKTDSWIYVYAADDLRLRIRGR